MSPGPPALAWKPPARAVGSRGWVSASHASTSPSPGAEVPQEERGQCRGAQEGGRDPGDAAPTTLPPLLGRGAIRRAECAAISGRGFIEKSHLERGGSGAVALGSGGLPGL